MRRFPSGAGPYAKPATGDVTAKWTPGMQGALAALYGPLVPMSDAERAEFASAKAKVQAADELRRAPSPQLELAA